MERGQRYALSRALLAESCFPASGVMDTWGIPKEGVVRRCDNRQGRVALETRHPGQVPPHGGVPLPSQVASSPGSERESKVVLFQDDIKSKRLVVFPRLLISGS